MRKMMPSKGTTIMDSLVDLLFQYRSTQYAIVAAMTLWAYDYLITFPAEIKLVWQKRNVFWTKILFSANRNLPIVYTYFIAQLILPVPTTVASRRDCHVAMIMIITSNILQLFIMHIIFTMRIYTLSNAYTRFQILVVVTLVISLTASTVFAALTINEILPAFIYSSQFKTCIYLTPNKTLYPVLITTPSLMLETLIFVATIYHTIQFQRKVSALEGARSVGILKRLLLHGGQFYALVILSRVSIFLSVYTAPLGVQNLVPTCNYFLTSVIISRFVLSLQREIVDSRKPEESGLGMTGPSIMITRTPITFPYSERLFGDSGGGGGGGGGNNSFEPETFISMETLGPYSRNEESDEHAHIPSSNERDFDH